MKKKNHKTLLLIDTSALIHRSYHAIPPLMTKSGEMVNAVYGVASTILSVEKEFSPDYMIAAYDVRGETFRHKAYDGYKAKRRVTPDDLVVQFGRVRELMDAFGIPGIEKEGFEADDVIGTIAREVTEKYKDVHVVIVTGDNDALQLVAERIHVRTFGRGMSDARMYDRDGVEEKYGLPPEMLIDYKGLAGDASDNIPGVTGVGHKTAVKLLVKYGSIENIYAHIDEQKGALKSKLERDRAQAFLSRDLGRIRKDVSLHYKLEDARVVLNTQKIRQFFQEMNFFSLLKRLPDSSENDKKDILEQESVQEEKYRVVALEDVDDVLSALAREEYIAVSIAQINTEVVGCAFSPRPGRVQFVLWSHQTQDAIMRFFTRTDRRATITTFDLKSLMHVLAQRGIMIAPPYNDVMLQAYVLGAGTAITLKRSIQEVLGEEIIEEQQMSLVPDREVIYKIAQREADAIYKLTMHYKEEIAQVVQTQKPDANIAMILDKIETPLVRVLWRMEHNGIMCDGNVLKEISEELHKKIGNHEKKIYKHAEKEFNINSPKQLALVLFDELKLPTDTIKKTKTGYSTAVSELEKLQGKHPIIAEIMEYRELFKLMSTYVDILPTMTDDKGRIHSTFQQAVTATGRLSSTDPNLQNIPTRTEYGQRIRRAFTAQDGYVLVSADYSQIDLRCVAHIANDKKMIEAFRKGEDIHETTAREVFGVTKSKVTKTMRRQAKALNFGLIYGMGAYGFAQSAGIDIKEARVFIDKYFTKFHGVQSYMENIIAQAKKDGYVETEFGRRRSIPEINSPNQQLARSGERMAINMPVQGMAADIMKYAMIAVDRGVQKKYTKGDVRIVLQVHDEIIYEVRESCVPVFMTEMKATMEDVVTLRVPLVVDVISGKTWADLK